MGESQTHSEKLNIGLWSEAGVPQKGWSCIGIEDLGAPVRRCEMCHARDVRYAHLMAHADYPAHLSVGSVCAGHMESDLLRARRRESSFKSDLSRQSRWLTRTWRVSHSGNQFLKTKDGFHVVVYSRGRIWGARVQDLIGGKARSSRLPYATPNEAKLAAFKVMLGMKHSRA